MFRKNVFAFLLFILLLVFWEIVTHLSSHLLFVLPSPSSIVTTLFQHHERLLFHTWITLKEMLAGFSLALSISFPLAWIMIRFQSSRSFFQPLFVLIQCLPMFTLAPLMVIWFGWTKLAIIIPTALMIFFPLTINIYQGLKATPKELLEFFQTHQATPLQTFFKLRLPSSLPHIFAGFRISAAVAGGGAIAGEWAGAQNGLGPLMLESRRNSDLEITFCSLLLLTGATFLFYAAALLLEKIFISRKWKNKKSFVFFLVPLMLLISFWGWKQNKIEKTHLLLDWLPIPTHVPLYVGIEKEFFKAEKIELDIQKMQESGGGLAYLQSGKTDLLVGHLPSCLRAVSKGAQIKIVGTLIKEPLSCLLYNKNLNIEKASDLSGYSIGYCLGGSDGAILDYLLAEGEIIPKEKVHVGVDLISALGTNRVAFLFGTYWNIEPHQLKAMGVETGYFKLSDFNVPNYYELIILSNSSSKYSRASFVERFQRALQKSLDYCKQHPKEAFQCYVKHNPDKREKNLSWEYEAWLTTCPILSQNQVCDQKMLETLCTWLINQGFISQAIDYKSLII